MSILILWIICGILSYGICFADFQRMCPNLATYDYKDDMRVAMLLGLCGVIGLLVTLLECKFWKYGLKFW